MRVSVSGLVADIGGRTGWKGGEGDEKGREGCTAKPNRGSRGKGREDRKGKGREEGRTELLTNVDVIKYRHMNTRRDTAW